MEQPVPEQIGNIEAEISNIKSVVDQVIRDELYGSSEFLYAIKGKLTTDPSTTSPEINSETFYGACGTICESLQTGCLDHNILLDKTSSEDEDSAGHVYLTTKLSNGSTLIIEPSIGQFIEGHNHVFIGSREQLHDLVINQTGTGKKYQIVNTRSKSNSEEAFRRIWGTRGKPQGGQMTNPEHRRSTLETLEIMKKEKEYSSTS